MTGGEKLRAWDAGFFPVTCHTSLSSGSVCLIAEPDNYYEYTEFIPKHHAAAIIRTALPRVALLRDGQSRLAQWSKRWRALGDGNQTYFTGRGFALGHLRKLGEKFGIVEKEMDK